jgi:MerR family copper efflux transcriptional regulator
MNIGQLAAICAVSSDTIRYYEKQGLLAAPMRKANGYRSYTAAHAEMLKFVRGAQALGFSLAEIRAILPLVAEGKFGRIHIEQQLQAKMAQIDEHMAQLRTLKKELQATYLSLSCAPTQSVTPASATATDTGSGAGLHLVRMHTLGQIGLHKPD